jgi:hydroxymethylpyrimidine/phosphomethylpyrimidine kinase
VAVPRCLTIAGSHSGGGAGIQADLKAFAAAGAHGTTAIVALTAQSTVGVTAVHELPPGFLLEDDAVEALVARLFPLATVVTPNLMEARARRGAARARSALGRRHQRQRAERERRVRRLVHDDGVRDSTGARA